MELREMSESGEKQEKDVTLNDETSAKAEVEPMEEKTETENSEVVISKESDPLPAEEKQEAKEAETAPAEDVAPAEDDLAGKEAEVDEGEQAEEATTQASTAKYGDKTKAELVDLLQQLLEKPVDEVRDEVTQIKVAFYNIRKVEIEKEKEEFLAKGNEEAAFAIKDDADETKFKEILNALKEKRAEYNSNREAQRVANLERKQAIIEELNGIIAEPDSVNKQYNRFQQLQQEFKSLGEVPATSVTELWKSYQLATENFYDLLKINKELRDYDFKKNLELKEQLCAEAEELDKKEDIVAAFKSLQELHNEWRETGPVAKELRENLWTRFKDASSAINKKYQAYFEERKGKEKENEEAKTAICEKVESIEVTGLTSYAAWDECTKQIIALQEDWKKLGFAARKVNAALFARFRKACDEFFAKKAEFFKAKKEELSANLKKKEELCEKAEALKDSTDWKKTTDILVALQKEWKTVGPVAKKHSDAVWKRFITACDAFFEEKNKRTNNVRKEEHENLKAKKEVITSINAILADEAETEGGKKVHELIQKWQEIGHVPFKEKDKIYAEYKEAINAAFDKFDMKEVKANLSNFESSISQISDKDKIYKERDFLVRSYEQKRSELKTFENNLGFFNATSKSGNTMLKEMERRIQKIKDDLSMIEKKIELIDSKMN